MKINHSIKYYFDGNLIIPIYENNMELIIVRNLQEIKFPTKYKSLMLYMINCI